MLLIYAVGFDNFSMRISFFQSYQELRVYIIDK